MKNFWLDVILIVLFVAEMSFHFLPKVLHEILGVALTAGFIFHVTINRRRVVSMTKKMSPQKIISLTTDFALIICAAIIFVSGVCMSNYLFTDAVSFELRRNMTLHQLHVALPYVIIIFIGVHVGLHWQELRQRLMKFFGTGKIFGAIIVTLSAIGLAGMYLNRVGDRILMKHIFATPATELPAAIFVTMIFGEIVFFALITVLLDKKLSAKT
jgi:hypothetical protein